MNTEIGEVAEGNVLIQKPGDFLAASEGKGKETPFGPDWPAHQRGTSPVKPGGLPVVPEHSAPPLPVLHWPTQISPPAPHLLLHTLITTNLLPPPHNPPTQQHPPHPSPQLQTAPQRLREKGP